MDWQTLLNPNRPRTSTSPGDHRAEFERDFDRAVFSTPVKRLQDKAQVFPLDPHDGVRTRLTHSLEVSSVARGLATAIASWLLGQGVITRDQDRSIEAIAATCGLIHDLGNPPFGHAGESAIQSWFAVPQRAADIKKQLAEPSWHQDFLAFEGNAQTLRLVTKLQLLADYNGLNLTFGTLSASCKYLAPSDQADPNADRQSMHKPGHFTSERNIIAAIRERTGTGDKRNPITFLVEAADDIVYLVADVEDAIKKGILPWTEVRDSLTGSSAPECGSDVLAGTTRILEAGSPGPIPKLPDDIHASAFRTSAISMMVKAVVSTFKSKYDSIMDGSYDRALVDDCAHTTLAKHLRRIGKERIYCTPSTLKLELMGRRVIHDLMTLFWEGAEAHPTTGGAKANRFPGKLASLLSDNYRRVFQHSCATCKELPEHYHRMQLVTDQVCGMTDSFAKRLHAELTNGG